MPYKDPAIQRAFQNKFLKERRDLWLASNGPCSCGSRIDLQVDHVDPSKKVDHKVWSWSEKRRAEELSKCQVLCKKCHRKKTNKDNNYGQIHGTYNSYKRYCCRCAPCKKASAEDRRRWKRNR